MGRGLRQLNAPGGMRGGILFSLALVWLAIYCCIYKGVESAGCVVYLTVPLPVLILFILTLSLGSIQEAGPLAEADLDIYSSNIG